MSTTSTAHEPETSMANTKPPSRSPGQRKFVLLVLVVAAALAVGWWTYQRSTHVFTDDARVSADLVVISSKVAGRVDELAVKEGHYLQAGDLIAQLDTRETELRVEELRAQINAMDASMAQLRAEVVMVEQQTAGALQAAESQLTVAQSQLASAEADLQLKRADWERSQSLRDRGILSMQGWEQSRSAFQVAEQNFNGARAQVASASARLVEANASRARLAVLEQQQIRLRHDKQRLEHQLSREQVNLDERRISSPLNAIVDQTFVNPGEYLLPGQRIAMIHNTKDVWVRANIKETEIRHLAVGQAVEISVDAYPDRTFMGEIERIGNSATSQFALLPNTNPSGNFTKVTQRLPVKIAVTQEEQMLKPGMMVEIAIDIR